VLLPSLQHHLLVSCEIMHRSIPSERGNKEDNV
jgi:hypothetical protein